MPDLLHDFASMLAMGAFCGGLALLLGALFS